MAGKSRDYRDEFEDLAADINMSDAELERLMAGHSDVDAASSPLESLEPGTRIRGIVVDVRGGEVLLELDSKTYGVVDEDEFEPGELPEVGSCLEANFVRHDAQRGLVILSGREARREILWEDLRPGVVLEGTVTETNKGGLVLDIKGLSAFLPVSQISVERVEDTSLYVGRTLRCEVTSVDRSRGDVVVSRRAILEREAEELRGQALARLSEGETLTGRVTRITEHGAFVDLGGVEGLLHISKIRQHQKEIGAGQPLKPEQQLEVEILRVDRERGRISLDIVRRAGETWKRSIEGYSVGDEATGWVTRVTAEGAYVSIDEGVQGFLPRRFTIARREKINKGAVVRTVIRKIERERQYIELEPLEEGGR